MVSLLSLLILVFILSHIWPVWTFPFGLLSFCKCPSFFSYLWLSDTVPLPLCRHPPNLMQVCIYALNFCCCFSTPLPPTTCLHGHSLYSAWNVHPQARLPTSCSHTDVCFTWIGLRYSLSAHPSIQMLFPTSVLYVLYVRQLLGIWAFPHPTQWVANYNPCQTLLPQSPLFFLQVFCPLVKLCLEWVIFFTQFGALIPRSSHSSYPHLAFNTPH